MMRPGPQSPASMVSRSMASLAGRALSVSLVPLVVIMCIRIGSTREEGLPRMARAVTRVFHDVHAERETFSPDGRFLAVAWTTFGARVVTLDEPARAADLDTEKYQVMDLLFSSDGARLVMGDCAGGAAVWGLQGASGWVLEQRWDAHEVSIAHLSWESGGKVLRTQGFDGHIRSWEVGTWRMLDERLVDREVDPWLAVEVIWLPESGLRVESKAPVGVRLRDAATGRLVREFPGSEKRHALCLGVDPSGRRVVTGQTDGTVHVWEIATGRLLGTARGHEGPVFAALWTADGATILSADCYGTVIAWDVGEVLGPGSMAGASPSDTHR